MTAALATLHPDLQDLVGRTIAERYRIDALLGVGGMGAVFRAHHLGLHRDVAIKLLHPSLCRDPEISSRFDREARSASRLDHPNCLQVTDFGTTEQDMKFMVMQLLDGRELSRVLGKPLSATRALALTLQICRGLEHAHAQGVVHRDVKPENVFITRDHDGNETLKLVDFGIAKIVGAGSGGEGHRTRAGLIFGTPAYMSPEQAAGLEADERADLYSLGIILYEMLAGRPPFVSDDPVALVRMQVGADPPQLPGDVPPMVAAIVERMLAKQREHRFQSAKELRDTIEGTLAILRSDLTPSAEMPMLPMIGSAPIRTVSFDRVATVPPPQRVAPVPRRRRVLVGVGAGALALGTLWALGANDDAPVELEGAVGTTESVPDDLDEDPAVTVLAEAGPTAEEIAEIDALLAAGKADDADKLLSRLRDRFPKDAQLSWRHGKVLATRKTKRAQALAAYGDAIEIDPTLLDSPVFSGELRKLMKTAALRDDALDLAVHQMGHYGHPFLLELVNSEKPPLSYDKRHRALDELATRPEDLALVDHRLNMALDLMQAEQSLTPCQSYREALATIDSQPEVYFVPRVQKAPVPKPVAESAVGYEPPPACDGLDVARQSTLDRLLALTATGDTDGEIVIDDTQAPAPAPKPAPAKPRSSKKSTKKKADDCDRLRGVLKKKCWQK
ncbi:MAG: serine/threonine protein kinase [Deltaproteobacteria bacterium]|nr:serine/threonine protein kinase [Deltaproteobacteria bacterium]MBK8713686.1 serine/threonine protein kinase [Deltaproteobacteria bacterium]